MLRIMNKHIRNALVVVVLCAISVMLVTYIKYLSWLINSLYLDVNDNRFRNMNITCSYEELSTSADDMNVNVADLCVICSCMNNGIISTDTLKTVSKKKYVKIYNYLMRTQPEQYNLYRHTYNALINDIRYFPIPRSNKRKEWVNYVDSWNNERTYKGNRTHEGTDIMGGINKDGIYPVVSVSDGYISNIGWLELGGYRIGITSDNGLYYYYAHLDSYAKNYKKGDRINAGDIIGFMGSTGYSKVEGTKNKFPVHLHFGIYITDTSQTEISINPYNILKINENNTLIYSY